MDLLLPPFSLFAFGFFYVASFGIIGLLITKFILAIHFTIQTRLPEVRGYRVISFHLYRCVLHFFNLLYLFISLFPLHTISIPFCICIHYFISFPCSISLPPDLSRPGLSIDTTISGYLFPLSLRPPKRYTISTPHLHLRVINSMAFSVIYPRTRSYPIPSVVGRPMGCRIITGSGYMLQPI